MPNVARTWAPKGHTPVVRYLYKQDRLSTISALAVSPKRRQVAPPQSHVVGCPNLLVSPAAASAGSCGPAVGSGNHSSPTSR
ncbi:MAG: hypothetical protein JSS39_16810 [Nitrospira sp.]|nr:hypothetical protein [Nitrospira sp.]